MVVVVTEADSVPVTATVVSTPSASLFTAVVVEVGSSECTIVVVIADSFFTVDSLRWVLRIEKKKKKKQFLLLP